MSFSVDLYWSFRSPYCYLITSRIVALTSKFNFSVKVKPVLPIELRVEGFFANADPNLLSYGLMDQRRVAEFYDIDLKWPDPDPIVQDLETGEVANEQPYIYRLARLGVAAARIGKGLSLIDEVSKLIWSGKESWLEGDALARAAKRAGMDLNVMESEVQGAEDQYDEVLKRNGDELRAAGHWGTPSMVFKDEIFFGQDRLDLLMWRMQQQGLQRRNES